jgi:hypothetical protein
MSKSNILKATVVARSKTRSRPVVSHPHFLMVSSFPPLSVPMFLYILFYITAIVPIYVAIVLTWSSNWSYTMLQFVTYLLNFKYQSFFKYRCQFVFTHPFFSICVATVLVSGLVIWDYTLFHFVSYYI